MGRIKKEKNQNTLPKKYNDIIDFFINNKNKERHIQQICKGVYGEKFKPAEKGSHYPNVRRKCSKLRKINILTYNRRISKKNTEYTAKFYRINSKLEYDCFKRMARRYLDEELIKKRYRDLERRNIDYEEFRKKSKLTFMFFAQNILDEEYIDNCFKNKNISFPDEDTKIVFRIFVQNFPGALCECLYYEPYYIDEKGDIKSDIKKEEFEESFDFYNAEYSRLCSKIQIKVLFDLEREEYIKPLWWNGITVKTTTEITPLIEKNIDECGKEELKFLCNKFDIKYDDSKKKEKIIKKIIDKNEKNETITIEGDEEILNAIYFHNFDNL